MMEDDDKPKKHTFDSLFSVYCNYAVYPQDVENEFFDTILLSQIDAWLDQAKLLKTVFTLTETGLTYMKFKKWRLSFEQLHEFLLTILDGKEMTLEELKEQMLEAGPPGNAEAVAVK